MEQKTKKYSELNRYEKAMTNAALEQRLEAMAQELKQMSLALGTSIHVNATFHDWQEHDSTEKTHATVDVYFPSDSIVTRRDVKETGDLFGIIEEALNKSASSD